jgi:hypothetical protein
VRQGLGMPDAALASIPEPLMFAITDNTGDPVRYVIISVQTLVLLDALGHAYGSMCT